MLGELKLMPPRTAMKVNCLVMRHLHFGSVRGDLQELRHEQPAAAFAIRRLRPWLATASSSTRYLRPRPCDSLIRRRYGGGVGNRCRWAERFAMSEQQPYVAAMGMGTYMLIGAAKGRTPQLRVSKSGPGAPDC